MWYPQILQTMNDLEHGGDAIQICTIVNSLANRDIQVGTTCSVVGKTTTHT